MFGRLGPITLSEVKPVAKPQYHDQQQDDHVVKLPSLTGNSDENASGQGSVTLDILKSENSFDALASKLVGRKASLRIFFDENTQNFVYESVDRETGEVISQWPPEDFIRRLAHLLEVNAENAGQAVDEKA